MRYYKFTKKEYAINATKFGEIQVGTLRGYGDTRQHTGLISDENEGISTLKIENDIFTGTAQAFNTRTGSDIKRNGLFHMYGGTYQKQITSKNVFIFCMSISIEKSTVSWALSEGYDACYEITDLGMLSDAIHRQLSLSNHIAYGNVCEYGNKEISRGFKDSNANTDLIRSLYMKDQEFSCQQEYRLSFLPNNLEPIAEPEPKLIKDLSIIKCTKLIELN